MNTTSTTIVLNIDALVMAITEQPPEILSRLALALAPHLPPAAVQTPSRRGPLATVPEVAEHMACKRQRVDDLLSRGRLTRVKDGGRTLIRWDEVDRYLSGQATGPVGSALAGRRGS